MSSRSAASTRPGVQEELLRGALQWSPAPGTIDLGPGYPGPALWPTRLLADAAAELLTAAPGAGLLYGAERGPEALRRAVAVRVSPQPALDQLIVTAGTSAALEELCVVLTRPGDVVLVEDTTYDLARTIFEDHRLVVQPVATDRSGVEVDDLADRLSAVRARGERVCFAYLIPTHHNPTGRTQDLARRQALVELAAETSLLVVEDDAYESLWYEQPPPPTLRALDRTGSVIRLGTFSKTIGPGLRVGWLEGSSELVDTLASRGVRLSGGGSSQLAAMLVASVLHGDGYDRHVAGVREILRRRWQAIASALAETPGCRCVEPTGGYFAWIELTGARPASSLVRAAREHGVVLRDGSDFGAVGDRHVRLALSYHGEEELRAAAQVLARVISQV